VERVAFGLLFASAAFLFVLPLSAEEGVAIQPDDVRSVFFIARSQNKNQVHYGVHVDAACEPLGTQPVFAYWRMLERRGELEPILGLEQPAYGLHESQRIERHGDTTTIGIKLRAFPERPLSVVVKRTNGKCEAAAIAAIAGADARLHWIYVKIRWPFGIGQVLVHGSANDDGRQVEELIE
jgi:Domain of unknown function (DUF4833)